MPAPTIPYAPRYVPAPATKEDCMSNEIILLPRPNYAVFTVDWADLPIIDFSKVSTPEGRAELAPAMRDGMHTHGFVYIVNHGLSQAQVRATSLAFAALCSTDVDNSVQRDRMFDVADVAFAQVPEEEKKQFTANFKETGLYSGYKLRQYWVPWSI